jgi:hypothetical protein
VSPNAWKGPIWRKDKHRHKWVQKFVLLHWPHLHISLSIVTDLN